MNSQRPSYKRLWKNLKSCNGKYEPMEGTEKKFTFWADKPGAYWVGEGQKLKRLRLLVNATMRAFKLGVILPVTKRILELHLFTIL